MRVHVVSVHHKGERILDRLAHPLGSMDGWTIGSTPDASADVNYFFPYLEYRKHRGFSATQTAAYFTHKDLSQPGKVNVWNEVAAAADLRLTSAELYIAELQHYGPTYKVTPPLEKEHFTIAKSATIADKPHVGVSGFVYAGGRKGEGLVKQLAADTRFRIDLVASGDGWPVPTRRYDYRDLPRFFQGLDVYLCTSNIEGIGYPVLEALACGVKVVIPHGVGIFDELPDDVGIERYIAGDYDDMVGALQRALNADANPDLLRSGILQFDSVFWQRDHERAMRDLLDMPDSDTCGVVYVAYGDNARECATWAVQSAKQYLPAGVEVAVISDSELAAGEDIFLYHPDVDYGGRTAKTRLYDLVPAHWQYVLYLDADTEMVGPDIKLFFDLLKDGWELVFCLTTPKYALVENMFRSDNKAEIAATIEQLGTGNLLQLQGGVFAFRRCAAIQHLMAGWHREWLRWGKKDQPGLDRALYRHPVKLYLLGTEWNTTIGHEPPEKAICIRHYPATARRWGKRKVYAGYGQ
jgi:hypothetical protein